MCDVPETMGRQDRERGRVRRIPVEWRGGERLGGREERGRGTVKSTLEVEVEHLKFKAYLTYRVNSRLAWVRKSNGASWEKKRKKKKTLGW